MVSFKKYLLEYASKENKMHHQVVQLKNKNRNPDRAAVGVSKKTTTTNREYIHDSPHVNNLINGKAHQIKLSGEPLLSTLRIYGVEYSPGQVKGLGNSKVKVKMFDDESGNCCGMLIKD